MGGLGGRTPPQELMRNSGKHDLPRMPVPGVEIAATPHGSVLHLLEPPNYHRVQDTCFRRSSVIHLDVTFSISFL